MDIALSILPYVASLMGGGLLTYFFAPRSRKYDQEDAIRKELWQSDRELRAEIANLTKHLLEQSRQIAVLQERENFTEQLKTFEKILTDGCK